MKKTVVIGLLGTKLDNRGKRDRWSVWRPTVAIGQQEDLLVGRLDLLSQPEYGELAQSVTEDFRQVSPESEIRLHNLDFPRPWDFESVYATLLDFAHHYEFDTENEDYLVHISTGTHVMQICLFLLVESRIIPARLLQTGCNDPRDPRGTYTIIDLDLSKYDSIAERFGSVKKEGLHFLKAGIETQNAAYNRMIEEIETVSTTSDAPMLLTGPSGVGKTRLARLIYDWKKKNHRVSGRFVEVNCATLRGSTAMSALFGHRKGAYTGADSARRGLLGAADGGLLFLDEVGELGADEQAMLLRAIEEKRFYPLGSDEEIHSDFQLICGTNRNLRSLVREGKFRADLLARIDLWTFELPSLKNRPEDIGPNLGYELENISERLGRTVRMNKEAQAHFLRWAQSPAAAWTSNFRDLSAAVTRMATLSRGGRITLELVSEETSRLLGRWKETTGETDPDFSTVAGVLGEDAALGLDLFDIAQLACVIRVCRRTKSAAEAGRKLFAQSLAKRTTRNDSDRLRKYLSGFGLTWQTIAQQQ